MPVSNVKCCYCDGHMQMIKVPRFGTPHGIAMVVIGVLMLTFIHVGGLLGIVVLPFGLVVLFSKKRVWHCTSCYAIADRTELKLKPGPRSRAMD
jgi:hypothetical protein